MMNFSENEQKQIGKMLFLLAEVSDFQLSQKTALTYVGILSRNSFGLSFDQIINAIQELILKASPGSKFPPLATIIREAGGGFDDKTNDLDDARDVAARIISAVSSLGRFAQRDMLEKKIGEVGMSIVEMKGGWQRICETMEVSQQGIWEAQFRDLAQSLIHRHRRGVGDGPAELPRIEGRKTKPGLTLIGDMYE